MDPDGTTMPLLASSLHRNVKIYELKFLNYVEMVAMIGLLDKI